MKSRPNLLAFVSTHRKILLLSIGILAIATSVRILTFQLLRTHLHDPAWFQTGSYAKFDKQAKELLDGSRSYFWIDDSTRTDLAQYPPAFPWWVAAIYKLTGERSAYAVQNVQSLIDFFLALILTSGIAVTAFSWRAGIATSFLVGVSPLLNLYGVWPSADVPTTWFVLSGCWALLLAIKRASLPFAFAAGVILGVACWFRVNPLYLCTGWAVALLIFGKTKQRLRLSMSAAVVLGTFIAVSPIVVRNYLVFPDFTPTGGTIGVNLWEGLGETELGREHGFIFGDDLMVEKEKQRMTFPPGIVVDVQWPDGIRRDHERTRESLAFIKQHPVWYAGVILKRMWGLLKVFGQPAPYQGSNGVNVTARKCLSPAWQGGVIALAVNILGMLQSVMRHLFLPLTVLGLVAARRRDLTIIAILILTVAYYLIPGTAAHTEMRYALPMYGILTVFAGAGLTELINLVRNRS